MKQPTEKSSSIVRTEQRNSDGYLYVYHLILRQERAATCKHAPLYSVTAQLTAPDGSRTEEELCDAFADGGKAILFFNRIVDYLATPTDLPYVFEDECRRCV